MLCEKTNMKFSRRVVLITGASSGIGADTAYQFARLGANVVIVGRNIDRLRAVADEIKESRYPEAFAIVADVTKDAERIIDDTIRKFGKLDVLVNSAGIIRRNPIAGFDINVFDDVINSNVRSVIILTKHAIPHLKKTKGNIVNVSSIGGLRPYEGLSAYCTSKAAIEMMTQCMALELGSAGVRVNAVCPGLILTPFLETIGLTKEQVRAVAAATVKDYPIGRVGVVSDVSGAIVYLANEDASFITGIILRVDGGRLLK